MPGLIWGGAILLVLVIGLDRLALATIRPQRKKHARRVEDLPFKRREHVFTSLGQELRGWSIEPKEDRDGPVVVLVHGWGSSHGRMTLLAKPLLEAGYPVFLFDIRHHGESYDAPYVTVRHFRDDTRSAVSEMQAAYPHRPLVLVGHSMGGSAAVLAVAEGAPVDGLITVAAPADLWGVWADFFDQRGLPGRWITRILQPFWRYRAGVPFDSVGPEIRVKEVAIPFLILHGNKDKNIPIDHGHILALGVGTDVVVLEGEGHNELLGSRVLHQKVFAFLQDCCGD